MITFEKTNHSSPGKKNPQSTASQAHPQTAEERDLLEVLYLISQQPGILEVMDFYRPEPPALAVVLPAKRSQQLPQLPERSMPQPPLWEQELLDILVHLFQQEDDLELTDLCRPAPLVLPHYLPCKPSLHQLTEQVSVHSPLWEQELLDILDHLSWQEDDLEAADFYKP